MNPRLAMVRGHSQKSSTEEAEERKANDVNETGSIPICGIRYAYAAWTLRTSQGA